MSSRPLELTTCGKACHLRFLPKTLPLVTKYQNHRRHSRLAHTSASSTSHHHNPRLYARISHDHPAQAHVVRLVIIVFANQSSLSSDFPHYPVCLSVSLEKKRRRKTPNQRHACICILPLLFLLYALYTRLLFILLACHFLILRHWVSFALEEEKKEGSRVIGGETLYSLLDPFLLEEKKKQLSFKGHYAVPFEKH